MRLERLSCSSVDNVVLEISNLVTIVVLRNQVSVEGWTKSIETNLRLGQSTYDQEGQNNCLEISHKSKVLYHSLLSFLQDIVYEPY